MIVRGHGVDDAPSAFQRLLSSRTCYGNQGRPIACPKSKSVEGFELSDRPWRNAPLEDIRALALTAITNKQLLRYVRGVRADASS